MEHNTCDLCGLDDYTIIWNKIDREKQGLLRSVVIRDENFSIVHGCNVICNNCGLVYITPKMSRERLAKFYEKEYRNVYGGKHHNTESEVRHAKTAYKIISHLKGKLLDVGCSTGKLLDLWDGEKAGVEPSQFKPPNYKVYNAVEDVEIKYNVITMLNALEHVHSPTETLKHMHTLLEDEGYLLLSVPDLYNTNIKKPIDAYLSNAHLYTFSFYTLSAMLQKCGFKPESYCLIDEEVGNKLYILSKKSKPNPSPLIKKPNVEYTKAFLHFADNLCTVNYLLNRE